MNIDSVYIWVRRAFIAAGALFLALIAIVWSRYGNPADILSHAVGSISATATAEAFVPWDYHVISTYGSSPDGVRLADLNGDGLMDVVSLFEGSGEVMAFSHPGYANVEGAWPAVEVGKKPRGEDAFAFDLDGDGAKDVISSHEGDTQAIFVHWAPPPGEDYWNPELWQSMRLRNSNGIAWMYALAVDVNEDGHTDILAGGKDDYFEDRNSVGEVGWFEAPHEDKRNLENWEYHTIDHAGWTMSLIAFDIDDDGDLDILITDRNADEEHMGARWLENPGRHWDDEWKSHWLGDLQGTKPTFMAMSDLDGDSIQELLVPLDRERQYVLLQRVESNGEIKYSGGPISFKNSDQLGTFKAAEFADIDLDGQTDLVVSFVEGEVGLQWMSFEGSPFEGAWKVQLISAIAGAKFDDIQLYDVDGDGDLDILTTEEVHDLGVVWFENPTIE